MNQCNHEFKSHVHDNTCINCKRPIYLYEVDLGGGFGYNVTFGAIAALDDEEALNLAVKHYPRAIGIQRDHWGRGPYIEVKKSG
jgi:hypothetical protein